MLEYNAAGMQNAIDTSNRTPLNLTLVCASCYLLACGNVKNSIVIGIQ